MDVSQYEKDFASFVSVIDLATQSEGEFHIPATADKPSHVQDLANELARLSPLTVAHTVMSIAAGDLDGAIRHVEDGLAVLASASPNVLVPADPFPDLARYVFRKFYSGDTASADSMATYAGVSERRRECRKIADQKGWDLRTFVEPARELGNQIRAAEAQRQVDIVAAAEASRKRKTSDDSDPHQYRRGVSRHRR